MKIQLQEITVEQMVKGYADNAEAGVVGYGGKQLRKGVDLKWEPWQILRITNCGVDQLADHQPHKLSVAGSSPAPATNLWT